MILFMNLVRGDKVRILAGEHAGPARFDSTQTTNTSWVVCSHDGITRLISNNLLAPADFEVGDKVWTRTHPQGSGVITQINSGMANVQHIHNGYRGAWGVVALSYEGRQETMTTATNQNEWVRVQHSSELNVGDRVRYNDHDGGGTRPTGDLGTVLRIGGPHTAEIEWDDARSGFFGQRDLHQVNYLEMQFPPTRGEVPTVRVETEFVPTPWTDLVVGDRVRYIGTLSHLLRNLGGPDNIGTVHHIRTYNVEIKMDNGWGDFDSDLDDQRVVRLSRQLSKETVVGKDEEASMSTWVSVEEDGSNLKVGDRVRYTGHGGRERFTEGEVTGKRYDAWAVVTWDDGRNVCDLPFFTSLEVFVPAEVETEAEVWVPVARDGSNVKVGDTVKYTDRGGIECYYGTTGTVRQVNRNTCAVNWNITDDGGLYDVKDFEYLDVKVTPTTTTTEEVNMEEYIRKDEVYRAAMEAARQHGYCDEVERALRKIGIEAPKKKMRVSFEVEVQGGRPEAGGVDRVHVERGIASQLRSTFGGPINLTVEEV